MTPRENWAELSDRSHTGASHKTGLIVHKVPVAIHQLSRAEGSYTHIGLYWETCNSHASTGPAQGWNGNCTVLTVCCTK